MFELKSNKINIPKFVYLSDQYQHAFFHIDDGIFYRISVTTSSNSQIDNDLKVIYDRLNSLKSAGVSIQIAEETCTINFDNFGVTHTFSFLTEVLQLVWSDTEEMVILKPSVETVTVKKNEPIVFLNMNFLGMIDSLNSIIVENI